MCSASTFRVSNFLCVCSFRFKFVDGTCNLGFCRQEMCCSRLNIVSNTGEKITKNPFLGSWEGLKSENLVQILDGTRAKMSQKRQIKGGGGVGQISSQPFHLCLSYRICWEKPLIHVSEQDLRVFNHILWVLNSRYFADFGFLTQAGQFITPLNRLPLSYWWRMVQIEYLRLSVWKTYLSARLQIKGINWSFH